MTIKSHDVLLAVGIPNKDLEVETATHQNLVSLRVCYLSNSFCMALKDLRWFLGIIIVQVIPLTELTFATNWL